jgi:3-deoxy-7-phosphoheptulonate synthase
MVVVMEPKVAEGLIQNVMEHLKDLGFDIHRSDGVTHTILGAVGDKRGIDIRQLEILEGVHEVIRISEPYKLASRSFKKQNTQRAGEYNSKSGKTIRSKIIERRCF